MGMQLLAIAAALVGAACGQGFIDPMKHDIFPVSKRNFDALIGRFRSTSVAAVLACKNNKECQKLIDGFYNSLALDLKGMITVAAVDCAEWEEFCAEHGATEMPSVVVLPPLPLPASLYKGVLELKPLKNHLLNYVPKKNVRMVSKDNVDTFLSESFAIPKVLFFSKRTSSPVLFNALSNSFLDRMTFGFISASETAVVERFKVKEFPALIVQKGEHKPETYKGKLVFGPVHEWLNIRSETFVKGGGFADEGEAGEAKPWLVQKVPEVTKQSHQDVCFRGNKGLCVIYLSASAPSAEVMALLEKLGETYGQADRGVNYRWSWMDMTVETNYKELFEAASLPMVVVFNPHKRLRFTKLDVAPTEDAICTFLDKIAGGDARFKNVKGQKLPAFIERAEAEAKKEEL